MTKSDNRKLVLKELLETERTFMIAMEELLEYCHVLESQHVLTLHEIEILFSNLKALVDFERDFFIILEQRVALPIQEQKLGALFAEHETAFQVYEPICGNYKKATQFSIKEKDRLVPYGKVIEPQYGLPSFLIKPVQRVCKYPLLLKEIIRFTEENETEIIQDLEMGLESAKRMTDRVNELKRQEENEEIKNDLASRVIDWQGAQVASFGNLLLSDKFYMPKPNGEPRTYFLYLFDNALVCCKEQVKKKKKINGKEQTLFTLKGHIKVPLLDSVVNTSKEEDQVFGIQVNWKDGDKMEAFCLKCLNIEQVKLWMNRLNKIIHHVQIKQKEHQEATKKQEMKMVHALKRAAAAPNAVILKNEACPKLLASAERQLEQEAQLCLKVNYNQGEFMLQVPFHGCNYQDLINNIENILKHESTSHTSAMELLFKDKEGDLVQLESDEDLDIAFHMGYFHPTQHLELFVH